MIHGRNVDWDTDYNDWLYVCIAERRARGWTWYDDIAVEGDTDTDSYYTGDTVNREEEVLQNPFA